MDDRAQILRRKIAHYRRLLSEGIESNLAQQYLREILKAEAELAQIEKDTGQVP